MRFIKSFDALATIQAAGFKYEPSSYIIKYESSAGDYDEELSVNKRYGKTVYGWAVAATKAQLAALGLSSNAVKETLWHVW
jgi:hypothetical protein